MNQKQNKINSFPSFSFFAFSVFLSSPPPLHSCHSSIAFLERSGPIRIAERRSDGGRAGPAGLGDGLSHRFGQLSDPGASTGRHCPPPRARVGAAWSSACAPRSRQSCAGTQRSVGAVPARPAPAVPGSGAAPLAGSPCGRGLCGPALRATPPPRLAFADGAQPPAESSGSPGRDLLPGPHEGVAGAPGRRPRSSRDGTSALRRPRSLDRPVAGPPSSPAGDSGRDSGRGSGLLGTSGRRGLFGESESLLRGRVGVAAAGGRQPTAGGTCRPATCSRVSGSLPSRACVRRGAGEVAGGAPGETRGAPLREAGRAAPAAGWAAGPRPGPAGEPAWRRAIGCLSGEDSPGRRRVCLRPDGGPLGGAQNFTRVRSFPAPPTSGLAGSPCAGRK